MLEWLLFLGSKILLISAHVFGLQKLLHHRQEHQERRGENELVEPRVHFM